MRTFKEAVKLYQQKQPEDWSFIPSEEFSSERCGGWLIRDANDMYIGWVGNKGDTSYASYALTTTDTAFDDKGNVLRKNNEKRNIY